LTISEPFMVRVEKRHTDSIADTRIDQTEYEGFR
jgi:hypothetical protein